MTVAIVGAAAISAHGASWRGLGEALLADATLPGVPAETPLANPRARNARKMMSRGAYLAAAALGDLMRDVRWTAEQRESAGYFLGVGASGGSLDDVTALLDASIVDGFYSLRDFGERGLAACNPLLAFQLMNNFTLAHGAIFEGLGGPNSALFSRGSGTTHALIEAVHAIRAGDCDRAIAGGADSATHPVTHAELVREGFVERGLVPAEGAAVIALASDATGESPVTIEGCAIASRRGRALAPALAEAVERALADASRWVGDGSSAGRSVGVSPVGDVNELSVGDASRSAGRSSVVGRSSIGDASSVEVGRSSVGDTGSSVVDVGRSSIGDTGSSVVDVGRSSVAKRLSVSGQPSVAAVGRVTDPDDSLVDAGPPAVDVFVGVDIVVVAAWGPAVTSAATEWARARFPSAVVVDTAPLGVTLAASPALAWVATVDILATRPGQRAIVIDIGVDGEVGAVMFRAEVALTTGVGEVAA